ncbi:MAG: carboxypeptidase regulatory-like domain-containing protein [Proteobacteria bacterium]|nr:carboxypeptidase regulatory-like domain-containing protein [Pseudomonadota bacterium]
MKKIVIAVCVIAAVVIALFWLLNQDEENSQAEVALLNEQSRIKPQDGDNRFSGIVVDGMTNQPLAAKIIVKRDENVIQQVTCDTEGHFDLSLDEGDYNIIAEYPEYVARGMNELSHSIQIHQEQTDPEEIILWPQGKIIGHIVADEQAVNHAEVKLTYQVDDSGAKDYVLNTVQSDREGNFVVGQVYGGKLDIHITADGYISQLLSDIEASPGETVDLGDIPLNRGFTFWGVISDLDSKQGIANATVKALDDKGRVLSQTTSAEDGSYRLPAVEPSVIHLDVSAEGYRDVQDKLSAGEQTKYEYNVAMTHLNGIAILVNNQTGREPVKTIVTVTDIASEKVVYEHEYENGLYTLDDLREGPYLVKGFSYDKMTEVSARALVGSTVTLTLKPFAKINVQFMIKKDNAPTTGTYRYIYTPEEGDEMITNWENFSKDVVLLDNLMPGTYRIEARTDAFWATSDGAFGGKEHISRSPEIHLEMGETRFVKLPLTVGGTLRAQINLPPELAGKPGMVMIHKVYENENGETTSYSGNGMSYDKNGEFIVDQLPEGEFEIHLQSADGYVSHFSHIKVEENDDLSLNLDMTHSRKQTDDGVSLQFPRPPFTDEEFKQFSDEEKVQKMTAYLATVKQWQEAIKDQEDYQDKSIREVHEVDNP